MNAKDRRRKNAQHRKRYTFLQAIQCVLCGSMRASEAAAAICTGIRCLMWQKAFAEEGARLARLCGRLDENARMM